MSRAPLKQEKPPKTVDLSIVIPVFNEQECLQTMFDRLMPVMDKMKRSYEVLFINDGSKDRSSEILREFQKKRPKHIRVIEFKRNFGQHMAITAGFENVRGETVVNLDADLQNPPEEIPKLIKKIDAGHDLVSGYREKRHDHFFRKLVSKLSNIVRAYVTNIHTRDHGCMLRAYRREIVDQIVACNEYSTFITVLAYNFASNPIDIPVAHESRQEGVSKYTPYKLLQYSLDLFTSFSLAPLRAFTIFGFIISGLSGLLVAYMAFRRIFWGPEAEGMFTLFAILFFLVSVAISGIGLVGEYIGRIYEVVRARPRFLIHEILDDTDVPLPSSSEVSKKEHKA
ncbi:MAG: glycosyltransferase [bacterium]|nr:glycosyltransferase [bacterium]